MTIIKAGIIGFGYMGHFHLNKTKQIEGVEAAAVYDIDSGRRKEAEEEGMESFDELGTFLEQKLDLVLICTPNQYHACYAIASMKAGKHVMCEKPGTMSVREMEEVIACREETGKIFTVHQNRRWDTDFLAVSEIVKNKSIGRITTIESRVLGERGVCYGWRADPRSGGGMLYDWGVHLIDQMLFLFKGEKVNSIYARILSILTPEVDDYIEIDMLFDGGSCAKVIVGTFALQKLPRWFVFGDRGTMKLEEFSAKAGGISRIKGEVKGFESVVGNKSIGPSRTMAPLSNEQLELINLPDIEEAPLAFWNNLVNSIRGLEEIYVKPDEVLRQIQIVEAAFLSSKRNEVIKLSI